MSFDIDHVVPRLIDWQLIDAAAVVNGELRLRSAFGRNQNLRVERRGERGLLIKRPDPGAPGARRTLRREGRFYDYCRRQPRAAALRELMPRHHRTSPNPAILVLELVAGARSLEEELRAHSVSELPGEIPAALGRALGTLHAAFRPLIASDPELADLGDSPPWALSIHRPAPAIRRQLSPANLRMLRILQAEDGPGRQLDRLRATWRVETVIHGDLRSDNVLVVAGAPGASCPVRLIDWELVQRGDPAWDVAAALRNFVLFWLLGMPLATTLEPAERASAAQVPLRVVRSIAVDFWRGYSEVAAAGGDSVGSELLRRAVGFSAAQLIQTAWEQSSETEKMTSPSVLMLQIAANILADPSAAGRDLFGLAAAAAAS